MRVLAAVAIVALLASPAHSEDTPQQRAQKQQKQDLENAYQKALKNTRSDAPTPRPIRGETSMARPKVSHRILN